jgi:AcrR family transcriptional regulator
MVKPNSQHDSDSRTRILAAAREVFHRAGFDGARTKDIADAAGMNKALLHYYFRSKDELFEAVFQDAFRTNFQPIIQVMGKELPLEEKVTTFVSAYIDTILQHPYIPGFVIHELNRNPQRMVDMAVSMNRGSINAFLDQIRQGIASGRYRQMDPRQAFVSLMAITLFPFIAAPLLKGVFSFDDPAYHAFITERKVEIPRMFFALLKH